VKAKGSLSLIIAEEASTTLVSEDCTRALSAEGRRGAGSNGQGRRPGTSGRVRPYGLRRRRCVGRPLATTELLLA
jgi:hypothetical protein